MVLFIRQRSVGMTLLVGEWGQHKSVSHFGTTGKGHWIKQRSHIPIITAGTAGRMIL
jgi:hypothetical protein